MVARLDGFESRDRRRRRARHRARPIHVIAARRRRASTCNELLVQLPNGTPLVAADGFSLRAGERTLLTGPSGSGKSTLFRAIAGIWPFGEGAITVPANAIADDAAAAAVFPDRIAARRRSSIRRSERASTDSQISDALAQVGLPSWPRGSDEEAHWNRMLSLGEQQRLGTRARAAAHAAVSVPRRSHRLARRALGSGAVPPARGETAGHHHRLDRPPLDARRVPPAQRRARAATATASRCRTASATVEIVVAGSLCGPDGARAPSGCRNPFIAIAKQKGRQIALPPLRPGREVLLQVGHRGQVGRELDDAGGAAPVRTDARRIDRGHEVPVVPSRLPRAEKSLVKALQSPFDRLVSE